MAWNGRNESILGAKPISPVAEPAAAAAAASSAPTPKQATESSHNNDRNTTASTTTSATNTAATTTNTAGAAAVAPPPPPNAWNGRNSKIMEFRDVGKVVPIVSSNTKEKETATSTPPVVMMSVISKKPDVIVDKASLRSSSTTSQGNSSCDKKNLNNHNKKNYVIKALSKEDETTSSTAGSSTTNTTIDEDPSTSTSPVLLEGNLVTTTVAVTAGAAAATTAANTASNNSSSERELTNNKRNSSPPSTADVKLPSRSNSADPSFTNSHSNNSRQNSHQQGRNNADSSDHHAHFVRRGNNRGGGSLGSNRGSNTNNNHNQSSSGKNNNNTASRGNASTGSGRRRGNKNEMPICSFFLQGLCTRGTSCNFRHDPSASADPTTSMNNTLVAFPSSSSNNINSNKQNTIVSPNQSTYHHRPPAVTTNNQIMNAMATSFVPSKRVFDPYKARAIQLAKEAQDEEDRSSYSSSFITKNMSKGLVEGTADISEEKKTEEIEDPPFFSIDVECVATGYGSCARGINDGCGNEGRNKEGVPPFQFNDRSHRYPGRVAMMDSDGNVLADIIIRPPKDGAGVLSYLTPLTGLTAELCLGEDAISLEEAVGIIKAALPKNGVIVGQAIDHDVEWLGLTAGKDFDRIVDISEIFRQRVPSILNEAVVAIKEKEADGGATTDGSEEDKSSDEYLGFATRYRHFSLRHVCLNLLGEDIQSGIHDPIIDAKYSLLLFHKYRNSSVTQLRIVRDGLHRAPPTPGFAAEKTPVIEGVCVSRAGYPYKRAARKIWRWFSARRGGTEHKIAAVGARGP